MNHLRRYECAKCKVAARLRDHDFPLSCTCGEEYDSPAAMRLVPPECVLLFVNAPHGDVARCTYCCKLNGNEWLCPDPATMARVAKRRKWQYGTPSTTIVMARRTTIGTKVKARR